MAVGLLVELEAVGVADVAEMAVMDVAVQRRAAFEELAAGQEADFVSRAVDVLHENMVDGPKVTAESPQSQALRATKSSPVLPFMRRTTP